MKQYHWFVLSASVGIFSTAGYLVISGRNKKRNAAQFLRKLTVLLNPKTRGLLAEKAFDIHYYKNLVGQVDGRILLIKDEVALKAARQIKENWGYFYNSDSDVQKINGILSGLVDKTAVSKMAEAYLKETGINLLDEFQSRLNEKQIKTILHTANTLKPYQSKSR